MALALNVFRTITKVVTTNPVGIYTAPVGYTGVLLLSQATNVTPNSLDISADHVRKKAGIAITTELLKKFPISGYDSVSITNGKLILESGDTIKISANTNNDIKIVLSILETLN
jgi:hypothetical protein